MSFSGDVKKELEGVIPQARHCQLAEESAILRFLGAEKGEREDEILLKGENRNALRKLFTLLKRAYNIDVVVSGEETKRGERGTVSCLRVSDAGRRDAILLAAGHASLLNMDCCKKAFLRGAFLASGSLSTPEKYYHLEFVCPDEELAETVKTTMKSIGYDAKTVLRKKDHVVYLKEGGQIVELLGSIGASISFLNIENIRILKEMRGSINRMVNCETANLNKTIVSAVRQIEDIEYIRDTEGFGTLNPALRQMAEVRLQYPEAPLAELGSYLEPPIGKSGVNHRLRKLSGIAADIRERKGT